MFTIKKKVTNFYYLHLVGLDFNQVTLLLFPVDRLYFRSIHKRASHYSHYYVYFLI